MKTVTMRLKNAAGSPIEVSFPDIPGEAFRDMWERREFDESMSGTLAASAIALVINGDTIKFPAWVVEHVAISTTAGLQSNQSEIEDWNARHAPTQVQIVDILQFLMTGHLDIGPRRLAVLVSAWDEVEGDGLEPAEVLAVKLPLLHQYLSNARDPWVWHVWGISAQGGVYEDLDKGEQLEATALLREIERPSDRIKVVDGKTISSDITLPLEWLINR